MKVWRQVLTGSLAAGIAAAQLSTSAYRVLGQGDLRHNSVNRVYGVEMYAPAAVAVDGRDGPVHLYVADTRNNRVLGWQDVRSYQTGQPPALVLGQPGPDYSGPMGIGPGGLNAPIALAVDPITGDLYVSDLGNNRILRFPQPFANPSRVEPDAVYGQPDFNSRNANTGGIGSNSLRGPRGLAFDTAGNLWISDTGNNRILRFNAAVLDSPTPTADLVLGQKDFLSGGANGGANKVSASGLSSPWGLVFDSSNNLYAADFANARVLKFPAPVNTGASAAGVFGQSDFTSVVLPSQPTNQTLAGPTGVALDNSGNLYVAVPGDNRVLVFTANALPGSPSKTVVGQLDFTSNQPNPSSFPLASARSFSSVADVKVDGEGALYAADPGNNRVLYFAANAKVATKVWGQTDFSANGANQIKAGSINAPYKIAIDYSRSPFALYVSDTNNNRILIWRDATSFRTGDPADLVIGQPDLFTAIPNVDTRATRTPSATSLASPKGLALDAAGNLYVADSDNNRVLRYPRPVDQPARIAPDAVIGQADFTSSLSAGITASSLRSPAGVTIGADGRLFVSDSGNNRVLEYAPGAATHAAAVRVYGQPNFTSETPSSPASAQTMTGPQGIFIDAASSLYVADTGNNRVLVFTNSADAPVVGATAAFVLGQDTFSGSGAGGGATHFRQPADIALDASGDLLVSDFGNNRILSFPPLFFLPLSGASATSVIGQRDLAGSAANWNTPDGLATAEGLWAPIGLFLDRRDTLYAGDVGNNRVVHYLKRANVSHAADTQVGLPLARGGLVAMTGSSFSDGASDTAAAGPWPLALAGREVVFNDAVRAPLSSLSDGQIKLQVPSTAELGTNRIAVRVADTGELVAGAKVPVAAVSPGLFPGGDTNPQFAIQNFDGSTNSASNPALRGSTIKIFGTGQGPVSPPVPDGMAAPSDESRTVAVPTADGTACLVTQPSVCVAIGTSFGEVQFSGLTPGQVGIWQISVKIPISAAVGNTVPLRAVINGVPSNIVGVAIR